MQIQALLLTWAACTMAQSYDVDFQIYPNQNCQGGGSTEILANAVTKSPFFPDQRSIKVYSIRNGKHLVLYKGGSQTGAAQRFYDSVECVNGDWLSYGVYNGGP
ncbi:hypothetical protein M409DRAFT_25484 [Zasmidium cellare ATCC 36951]|uniref:Uncharacterized protein n=1 Tax=Zasmidium cellare ATCC 36951 TaxID=1080233 RepID=A0A6A6CAB4_ZASCE|nr:uncharacterized protein M409DRAFT_25484 [Zasmidium cellare ATCC 36951]KAF2164137.1 hypothetical protein M409DRAFT_25484 [Zasmidium cellare ATCC 36951]